jgi:NAD+ kinase
MNASSQGQGRRAGLVANPMKDGAARLGKTLLECLRHHGWEVLMDQSTRDLLDVQASTSTWAEIGQKAEWIIVIGGDGTMLRTVREIDDPLPPLAAINAGTLGFLTNAESSDHDKLVAALIKGDFTVSERQQLEVTFAPVHGKPVTARALNEVAMTRGGLPKMIHLRTLIDGATAAAYSGDGLIIATPTGSTAYSLAAGGPLVSPAARVILLTPIACHSLANRTLTIEDTATIEIIADAPQDDIQLTLDGYRTFKLATGCVVTIRRSMKPVRLIVLGERDFYEVLRRKLGWTGRSV